MILCTSKPRNVYKPNDLLTSQYKRIKRLRPLGNPEIAGKNHVASLTWWAECLSRGYAWLCKYSYL
jgi:hypothetical protein